MLYAFGVLLGITRSLLIILRMKDYIAMGKISKETVVHFDVKLR